MTEPEQETPGEVTRIEAPSSLPDVSLTSMMQAQFQAMINVQAEMAFRRPRDEAQCLVAILAACRDPSLAEKAEWSFPRGGQELSGPTVHLLRAIAQRWKNINTSIMEIARGADRSKVMVYAVDVENNYMQQMAFEVPHYRDTKGGRKRLTDDRDIYEMVANQGARRQRKCLEDCIPRNIVQLAIAECAKTEDEQAKAKPIEKRIAEALKRFADQYHVGEEAIVARVGKPKADWKDDDIRKLGTLFNAIRDGHVAVEVAFAPKPEDTEPGADEVADELAARVKEQDGDPGTAEQKEVGAAAPGKAGDPSPTGAPASAPASTSALAPVATEPPLSVPGKKGETSAGFRNLWAAIIKAHEQGFGDVCMEENKGAIAKLHAEEQKALRALHADLDKRVESQQGLPGVEE